MGLGRASDSPLFPAKWRVTCAGVHGLLAPDQPAPLGTAFPISRLARPIKKFHSTSAPQRQLWPSRSTRGLISTRSRLDTPARLPAIRAQATTSQPDSPFTLGALTPGTSAARTASASIV